MRKFKQNGDWHVRDKDGNIVNLNSLAGADYVLELQDRVAAPSKPKRRRRRKVAPKETK